MPSSTRRVLFEDEYVTLTLDEALQIIFYTRSATPFASIEDVRGRHGSMVGLLGGIAPGRLGLLVDIRAAKPRNDEAFEAEITRAVGAFIPRFKAHAFLTKSVVGSLQARRLATSRGDASPPVFTSEEDALEHLQQGLED